MQDQSSVWTLLTGAWRITITPEAGWILDPGHDPGWGCGWSMHDGALACVGRCVVAGARNWEWCLGSRESAAPQLGMLPWPPRASAHRQPRGERHQSPAAVSPAARAGSRAAHPAAQAARSAARSAACGQPGCRFRQPSLPPPGSRPRDVPAGSAVARAAGPATGLPARQPGAVDGLPARQLSYRITLTERNLAGRVLSPSISLTPSSDGWIAPPRRPVTPHIHTPVGLHVLGR